MLHPKPLCENALFLGFRGGSHDVPFGRFDRKSQRGEAVCYKIDPEDVDGKNRNGKPYKLCEKECPNLAGVGGKEIFYELPDVVVNFTAFLGPP